MANDYEVHYRPEVGKEDFPKLPRNIRKRILRAIEERVMTEPTRYGVRLRRSLMGLWKLRVGDYRVVFEIVGRTVRVRAIVHRKDAYAEMKCHWKR